MDRQPIGWRFARQQGPTYLHVLDRQGTEPRKVWDALRASNVRQRDDYLPEIRIRKLRGLWNLRFEFEYPVSVLAGRGRFTTEAASQRSCSPTALLEAVVAT